MASIQFTSRSHGAVVVELLVALPVVVIAFFAVVELGLLITQSQYVEGASRTGAEVASERATLPVAGPVPADIVNAIQRHLDEGGITAGRITLEHNVDGDPDNPPDPPVVITFGALVCPTPVPPNVPPRPVTRRFVRVTVCVAATELAPNLLDSFGFDISNRVVSQTTTLRYEN